MKAYFLLVISLFTRLKEIYRIGRSLKLCGTVHTTCTAWLSANFYSLLRHTNKLVLFSICATAKVELHMHSKVPQTYHFFGRACRGWNMKLGRFFRIHFIIQICVMCFDCFTLIVKSKNDVILHVQPHIISVTNTKHRSELPKRSLILS